MSDRLSEEQMGEQLTHSRSCPALTPATDDACTCGLIWRQREQTALNIGAAWRKRAEEAESKLANGGAAVAWMIKTVHEKPFFVTTKEQAELYVIYDPLPLYTAPLLPAAPPNKGVTTEERMKHYPIEFGSPKRLECSCGNLDPAHPIAAAPGEREGRG